MRRLILGMALVLCLSVAHAEPTYSDKFAEYMAAGWTPDEIVAGLKRWFGVNFELVTTGGETYVQLILRQPDFSVYRLEVIGKVTR